jgi:hypothetical protein
VNFRPGAEWIAHLQIIVVKQYLEGIRMTRKDRVCLAHFPIAEIAQYTCPLFLMLILDLNVRRINVNNDSKHIPLSLYLSHNVPALQHALQCL